MSCVKDFNDSLVTYTYEELKEMQSSLNTAVDEIELCRKQQAWTRLTTAIKEYCNDYGGFIIAPHYGALGAHAHVKKDFITESIGTIYV